MKRDNDYEAYVTTIVEKYSDMIMRIAFTYLKHDTDAQDICQEVFVKFFKHATVFNDPEHEKAWIIRITINTCKDMLRSFWKKRFTPVDQIVLPITDPEDHEVVSMVLELPKKYCIIIYLYYFEGYSTPEIAALLHRKENTIRTQLQRARALLRNQVHGGASLEG